MKSLEEMVRPTKKAKSKAKRRMSLVKRVERKIKRTMIKVTMTAVLVPVTLYAGKSLMHKVFSTKS